MRMIYFDTFEAAPSAGSLTPNAPNDPKCRFFGALVETRSPGGQTGSRGVRAGTLSPAEIYLSSGGFVTANALGLGNKEAYQTSGKCVFGAAIKDNNGAATSRTLMRIPVGDTSSHQDDCIDLMLNKTTREITFLGEDGDGSEWVEESYAYVEVVIDITAGTFGVYLNNNLLFDGTHEITKIWNLLWLYVAGSDNQGISADDIYVLGGTDGPYSDRLGPVRAMRLPLDDTQEATFTPMGAATNLDAVNKTSMSTDSFNRSPALNGSQDRFTVDVTSLPDDKDVFAVQQLLYYRKTDIGDRGLKSIITDSGAAHTDDMQLPQNLVNFGGAGKGHIVVEVPGGGTLDKASIADMEFGYEVTAS